VPLRIAFDLDGVLADMDAELVRQAQGLFGESLTRRLKARAAQAVVKEEAPPGAQTGVDAPKDPVPPLLKLKLTSRQQRKLWDHVETIENFWTTLDEIEPGIVRRLGAVAEERRWEVIFLTKRPRTAGMTAQLQTQRWLEAKGFPLPSVYVVQGSRGRIAAALGLEIVVDDRPENCLDVIADSKARAILVWRDDESRMPEAARRLAIGVVKSVADCLDILTRADEQPGEQPGVMERLMRLLGLKEAASA
jgi:hypothetical protein